MFVSHPRRTAIVFLSIGLGLLFAFVVPLLIRDQKPEIITTEIKNAGTGRIIEGKNVAPMAQRLQTESHVTFESAELVSPKKANAAVLKWDRTGGGEDVKIELRTFSNKGWTRWVQVESGDEDRKDGTPVAYNSLVLADRIDKIQYRFALEGKPGKPSPEINLEQASIEMIDSSRGPSPTKKSVLKKSMEKLGLTKSANARADSPRIYSRAEWGVPPEHETSPDWTPEYRSLYRAIVHHTVTTSTGDSAANVRAVWRFHAQTRGYGDIGYNYLVDTEGNIFQGRYFDPNTAHNLRQDVVAGHAFFNNQGTTGIAAIGDFSNAAPPDKMIDSISNIIGFKTANYQFNPSGIGPNGPNVIGHREVNETACPGAQLFTRMQQIRNIGDIYYSPRAAKNRLDLTNQGQGYDGSFAINTDMLSGETRTAHFDLKNEGDSSWGNYGTNPTRLATDQPRDRVSPFFAQGSWISANRAATFNNKVVTQPDGSKTLVATDTILPGEVGRFSFVVTAPEAGGTYREHFQLVVEGREWFSRNLLLSTTINVTPRIYSWQPVAQHIFTNSSQTQNASTMNLAPGQRVYIVIKARNTGNQTWSNVGANPIRAATSNHRDRISGFCDPAWLNCGRPAVLEEATVAPGAIGTFGFWIKAPAGFNGYSGREYFSLVVEGKAWANTEPGIYWPVSITP